MEHQIFILTQYYTTYGNQIFPIFEEIPKGWLILNIL